jgi:hypothetical protein
LALFGRRPPERVVRSSLPASENLHNTCTTADSCTAADGLHSITSSVRASSVGGTSMPSVTLPRELRRYLGGRDVICEPIGARDEHRCQVDGQDLSRVVVFNGGGRATANAPADLQRLEQQARSAHAGIWGEDDDDD